MEHISYKLVSPLKIEAVHEEVKSYTAEDLLIKPLKIAICNADNRYYSGLREEHILHEKLPMALFHEGVGEVLSDPLNEYQKGDIVTMIPNILLKNDTKNILDNYHDQAKFLSSGYDGFAQNYLSLPRNNILKLSSHIDISVASFSEIISVACQLVNRFDIFIKKKKSVVLWGDGVLSFVTARVLKNFYPHLYLNVLGVNQSKLDLFDFADTTLNIENDTIGKVNHFDLAIEIVGSSATKQIINHMIDHIEPMGHIILMGVSEQHTPINTRDILSKGLTLLGISRSNYQDFVKATSFLENIENQNQLKKLIYKEINVHTIQDIHIAFQYFQDHQGKVILNWHL